MSDLRWAARLAFCEELWRDRARIVWDRRVEAVLAEGQGEDDALSRLVDAVVPRRAALDGARKRIDVSMGVGEEAMARRLAPRRPGTQFLTFGPLCEAIRRRDWDVALLDLSDLLMVDEPGGPSRLSMRGTELVDAVASRLTEAEDDGPAVVFGVIAQTPGADEAIAYGVDFAGLLELLEPLVRRDVPVRLYGMLRPTMAAMVELAVEDAEEEDDDGDDDLVDDLERTLHDSRSGPPPDSTFPLRSRSSRSGGLDETEDEAKTAELRPQPEGVSVRRGSGTWRDGPRREWSAAGELEVTSPLRPPSPEAVTARIGRRPDVDPREAYDDDDDEGEDGEDVPLSFDNTLGATEPAIVEYVVVAGAGIDDAVADGMTLVELPDAAAAGGAEHATDAPAPLRAQLAESRRQVDLSAIERQRLVERLDNLESSNTELRTEAADLRDRLARALTESAPAQGQERLDVAQAELQSLRWQLTQAQRSLDAARARPVGELEAEVATLTARLEGRPASPAVGSNGRSNGQASAPVSTSPTGLSPDGPSPTVDAPSAPGTRSLLARVDAIVQRVERSDISALELRKRLIELREGLTRLLPGSGR